MLHALSSLVLALIAAGLWCRRRDPSLHVRIMTAAFACDLLLVLYIEVTRHAVESVVQGTAPIVWFHATVSTLVLAAYAAQLTLGRRLLRGARVSRRAHALVGMAFVGLRSLNYATSFLL